VYSSTSVVAMITLSVCSLYKFSGVCPAGGGGGLGHNIQLGIPMPDLAWHCTNW